MTGTAIIIKNDNNDDINNNNNNNSDNTCVRIYCNEFNLIYRFKVVTVD